MQPWQIDVTMLGMVGSAAIAVVAAGAKAFTVAARFGRLLERTEANEERIKLIPGIAAELDALKENIGLLAGNLRGVIEDQRKAHSDMHELRERLAVGEAIREHSQGSHGE